MNILNPRILKQLEDIDICHYRGPIFQAIIHENKLVFSSIDGDIWVLIVDATGQPELRKLI